jgi:ectoine hydroxylase-related dioxygenase (phytanoyl-CoA dioxygenase family)
LRDALRCDALLPGRLLWDAHQALRRLAAPLEHAAPLVRNAKVLRIVETVLKPYCERIILNLAQAVELHDGALAQIPHRDQDLWHAARDGREYQVNVIWPLTTFTAENGATLLWPGSHRTEASAEPIGDPIAAEMEPGSALLWLGSTLHGGGANLTRLRAAR